LNAYEFEACPTYHGSGKETVLRRNGSANREQEARVGSERLA